MPWIVAQQLFVTIIIFIIIIIIVITGDTSRLLVEWRLERFPCNSYKTSARGAVILIRRYLADPQATVLRTVLEPSCHIPVLAVIRIKWHQFAGSIVHAHFSPVARDERFCSYNMEDNTALHLLPASSKWIYSNENVARVTVGLRELNIYSMTSYRDRVHQYIYNITVQMLPEEIHYILSGPNSELTNR